MRRFYQSHFTAGSGHSNVLESILTPKTQNCTFMVRFNSQSWVLFRPALRGPSPEQCGASGRSSGWRDATVDTQKTSDGQEMTTVTKLTGSARLSGRKKRHNNQVLDGWEGHIEIYERAQDRFSSSCRCCLGWLLQKACEDISLYEAQ